jgi:hypothetical protein
MMDIVLPEYYKLRRRLQPEKNRRKEKNQQFREVSRSQGRQTVDDFLERSGALIRGISPNP